MTIELKSIDFWRNYTTTALHSAACFLGKKADPSLLQSAMKEGFISSNYRPIILNYTDNSWNIGTGILSSLLQSRKPPVEKHVGPEEKTEKKEEEKAHRAKWFGAIFSIGGAFLTGISYQAYVRQQKTTAYTLALSKELAKDTSFDDAQISSLKENFKNLVQCQLTIDKLNTSKITNYFSSCSLGLIGAVTLTAGGFLSAPKSAANLRTTGYICLIASAFFAALNLGLHWNDRVEIQEQYEKIAGNFRDTSGLAVQIRVQLDQEAVTSHFLKINKNATDELPADPVGPPTYNEQPSSHLPSYEQLYPGLVPYQVEEGEE